MISPELEVVMHRCFVSARQARHQFVTVEHLVLEMLAERQVSDHVAASSVNVEKLMADLKSRVAATETVAGASGDFDTQPTMGFQRALQKAILQVQSKGDREVSLLDLLAAVLEQDDSFAASRILEEAGTSGTSKKIRKATARACSLCRKLIPMESLTTIKGRGVLCSNCIAAVLKAGRKVKR